MPLAVIYSFDMESPQECCLNEILRVGRKITYEKDNFIPAYVLWRVRLLLNVWGGGILNGGSWELEKCADVHSSLKEIKPGVNYTGLEPSQWLLHY